MSVDDVVPAIGGPAGGNLVDVFGSGFTGATSVLFDGVPATGVIVNDDSWISCNIPAHAPGGPFDVEVVGVGTLAAYFTYDTMDWFEVLTAYGGSSDFRDSIYISGNGGFLFVGDGGNLWQSTDGQTGWTQRTSPGAGTQAWKGVSYAPGVGAGVGRYVIVGNSGAIATSDDGGITWTSRTGALGTDQLSSVAWSGTVFVAVSTAGTVQSSTDGITWSAQTASVSRNWVAVTWSSTASLFVALGSNSGVTNGIMTSPDGAAWTTRTSISHVNLGGGFGHYVVADTTAGHAFAYFMEGVAAARWLITSMDGITWSQTTMDSVGIIVSGRPERIVDAPGLGGYLFVGLSFKYHVSTDGVTWVETEIPSPPINRDGDFCLVWAEDLLTNVSSVNGHPNNFMVGVFAAVSTTPTLVSLSPDNGPVAGGTTVTLTGTGFSSDVTEFAVTFDGQPAANVTWISATEVTCETPPHFAGAVDVVVTFDGGDSTLPNAFTYLGNFAADSQLLSSRRAPALRIDHRLNSGDSTMSFDKDGVVDVGPTVYATDPFNDDRIFTGPILKTSLTFDGDAITSHVSKVTATDKRWFLDKRLPIGKWTDTPVSTVVKELLATFAPDFTYQVEAGLDNVTLELARGKRLSEIFAEIAGVTGSHYRLDSENNKVIIGTLPSDEQPDDITDDPACSLLLDDNIVKDTDLSQIRTRVFVFGHGASGSSTYLAPVRPSTMNEDAISSDWDVLPGAGDITIIQGGAFASLYQLSAITADGEAFTISGANGRPWAYYWDLPTPSSAFAIRFNKIRAHPDSRVIKIGLYRTWQNDQSKYRKVAEIDNDLSLAGTSNFMTITDTLSETDLQSIAPEPPAANDTAIVVAVREDPTAATALAALEGGDGWHEYAIFDQSIITLADAEKRGDAELELFKNPLVTVTYSTRDPKSKVGREVNINLTDPPIVGTFKIQAVAIDQIHESNDLGARYRVTASSQRFTLEDFFHRLTGIGGGGGGGGSVTGGTGSDGGSSGWASMADKLTPGRDINGTFFDGSTDIDIDAGPGQFVPAGSVNSINTVFTTASAYQTGRLYVYLNGIRQKLNTDFTETTTTTFTMAVAPTTGDVITVDYVPD